MLKSYPYGSLIRFSVTFTNALTSQPADPTDIVLAIQIFPASAPTEFSLAASQVIRDAVGQYHYDYLPPTPGNAIYSWKGGGAVQAATAACNIQILDNPFS